MSAKTRPCERCGAMLPSERIEALPDTRLCVGCSQQMGGEFVVGIVPENLAKAGSLKKNYGGFTLHKRRKRIRPIGE